MIRVDAHHHVWRIGRGDYAWIQPGHPLHRDYRLADLRPLLLDISATVLVQAAPTEAETAYLLNVARNAEGLVRGVVGWENLAARDAPERIATLAADPMLLGLRPMLQDIADTGWILRPEVQPALAAMTQLGLRLDALVQPRHLPVLLQLAERHPDLPIVIDHAAKPPIASGALQPWAEDMATVARNTRAFCKLSGLVTEAGSDWTVAALRPYTDRLLGWFGPQRLIWGSDWPVVNLAGGYARWRDATDALLADLAPEQRQSVLGGSAAAFYGLA